MLTLSLFSAMVLWVVFRHDATVRHESGEEKAPV